MRLGAHISVAGGLHNAFQRGADTQCDSIMIFTKNNRQWHAPELSSDALDAYHTAARAFTGIHPVAVHASYLINVGSPDPALWQRSYKALRVEVERATAVGARSLTFHPGAYTTAGEDTGLANIARALRQLLADTRGSDVSICLETMAGQGTTLGHRFEHLARIIDAAGDDERLAVCFDTCHVFAAGYDLRTPDAYAATLDEFDRVVGLERIACFHFNDSKHGLGSRKDRHAHIGEGEIGLAGFANFVTDPRWSDHPAHLETPKTRTGDDGSTIDMDPINLAALRAVLGERE
ncbi:MAG: deoxyribonuclease IV [Anaerolineae bacterium]|nr:deoxyribonuclease IV [Anaerolineae bacterium]